VTCCVCQALVRSLNSSVSPRLPNLPSFKTSPTSLIDTFRQISLPGGAPSVSYTVADDPHSGVLQASSFDLNIAHSSQPSNTPAGYFIRSSPGYLSPSGSIETAALRELQAFASGGRMDHASMQFPDTTDSSGLQGFAESSGIGQSMTSCVAADDGSRSLNESTSLPSPSVCTMCGRGCGCQKQSDDGSVDSPVSWNMNSLKVESRSVVVDSHDCHSTQQSLSPSPLPSSPSPHHRQLQLHHSDITVLDLDLFSVPRELSSTLRELAVAARESPTGTTADLIEHTIQAVVDAHVNTCLYTSDKVATGLREYELMLSSKPLVC